MSRKSIAILGATSHVAKGLIYHFLRHGAFRLALYARSEEKAHNFLDSIGATADENCTINNRFVELFTGNYDVIINCIGVGTHKKVWDNYSLYFSVTEQFDNLAIDYLRQKKTGALYISLSSGIVYGHNHGNPVTRDSVAEIQTNRILPEDYYMIARLNAEAKHRAYKDLNIVDLRIFSYFSRFMDLMDSYFISDVLNSIINQSVLITEKTNFIRDFVHPEDFFSLIQCVIETQSINEAYDVFSASSVTKKDILTYFSTHYGLKYSYTDCSVSSSLTGMKHIYVSNNKKATKIGYQPKYTSMNTIILESSIILNTSQNADIL